MAEIHVEEHSSPIKTPQQLDKNAMPPKGGKFALSGADVNAAVDYMLSLVT